MRLAILMRIVGPVGISVVLCGAGACNKAAPPGTGVEAPVVASDVASGSAAGSENAVAPAADPGNAPARSESVLAEAPVVEPKTAGAAEAKVATADDDLCAHAQVVVGVRTGQALPGVTDLRGVVRHLDGTVAETEAKAVERLDYYGIKVDTSAAVIGYLDSDTQKYRVYLKLLPEDAPRFVAFDAFADFMVDTLEPRATVTGDGRYAVLATIQNYYERVPFCPDGDEEGDDCTTATGDGGEDRLYSVFDRQTGALLFDAHDSRDADAICNNDAAPTFADGRFTWTGCDGVVDAFALDDIKACTVEAFRARMDVEAAAAEAEVDVESDSDSDAAAADKPETLAPRRARELINQGRKLTKKKDYAGAIAIFGRVLAANADAVTARTGRGYAALMRAEGADLTNADWDFELVLKGITGDSPPDRKLKAQVLFNRGLIAQKRGNAEGAAKFFEEAEALKAK